MDTSLYRRNVFKTLSIKPAKEGVKYAARNTARINMLHGAVGLATEAMELLEAVQNYVLIGRMTQDEREAAFDEMGDCGYYLIVLAKAVKAKVPGAGKKLKLVGTRTKALLDFVNYAQRILSAQKKVFYGTKTKVHLQFPERRVLDAEAQAVVDAERVQVLRSLVEAAIDLFYRLSYDMFGVTPATVFDGNIAKLTPRYGAGFFEQEKALAEKDKPAEKAVIKAVMAAPVKAKVVKAAKPAKA